MRVKIEQRGIYKRWYHSWIVLPGTTGRAAIIRSAGIMKLRSGSVPTLRMSIICRNFPTLVGNIWSAM